MSDTIKSFHLPRYREIPTIGLYLEQTVKYINECLSPLRCIEVTSSMISNYVKKGYIPRPQKKQYDATQIAYLLYIAISKQVLAMDNVAMLLKYQQEKYSVQEAYDYFCEELEHSLRTTFASSTAISSSGIEIEKEKKMLRSIVTAVSHVIYLSHCFVENQNDVP